MTKTRLGRISLACPARSEPAPPDVGRALATSIIYGHKLLSSAAHLFLSSLILDVIVACP